MGQLRVVYEAGSEYMAIAMRAELVAHGIGSVQLLNEIPMNPGFTFGARPWAEILVSAEEVAEARAVVAECGLALNGSATAQPYPPAFSFNTAAWLGYPFISLLVFLLVLDLTSMFSVVLVVMLIAITALNWRMLFRETMAAVGGMLALPIILGWLIIGAVQWLIRAIISFGKINNSVGNQAG